MLKPSKLVTKVWKVVPLLFWRHFGTSYYVSVLPLLAGQPRVTVHGHWRDLNPQPCLSLPSPTLACAASVPNLPSHTAPVRHSDDSPQ